MKKIIVGSSCAVLAVLAGCTTSSVPDTPLAVPLATSTESTVKPVTGSLNVAVTVNVASSPSL